RDQEGHQDHHHEVSVSFATFHGAGTARSPLFCLSGCRRSAAGLSGNDGAIAANRADREASRLLPTADCRLPMFPLCSTSRPRSPPMDPTILHAELDDLYASVQPHPDPHLRGKPIAVGGGVV